MHFSSKDDQTQTIDIFFPPKLISFGTKYLLKLTQHHSASKPLVCFVSTNGYDLLTSDLFFPFFLLKIVFLEESSQQEKLAKEWCFKPCEIRELSHQ